MSERIDEEKRRRIQVAVWAYAYEVMSVSLVSDERFDATCLMVDLSIDTGNSEMDKWFRENFDPCTGMWVHNHPHKARLGEIARNLVAGP